MDLLLLYGDGQKLPHDIAQLHHLIHLLVTELHAVREELALLRRAHFGSQSEKTQTIPETPTGDTEPTSTAHASSNATPQTPAETKKPKRTSENYKHKGRNALPSHLSRTRIEHDLKPEDKVCNHCQAPLHKIGEVITEQLDVIPVRFTVKQHTRLKWACRCCKKTVKLADLPAQPIEKGAVSANLLAHILVAKYQDGLPLYRIQRQLKRAGIIVSRSTLSGWVKQAARELKPLWEALSAEIAASDHLWSDDTTLPTLKPGSGKTQTGRMWTYVHKPRDTEKSLIVYRYSANRNGEHPQTFLKYFRGILQADRYAGYYRLENTDAQGKPLCEIAACWAHARRKFVEAIHCDPASIAQEALTLINTLYDVERIMKDKGMTSRQKRRYRHKKSAPILQKLKQWLKTYAPQVVPGSRLGQAITYTQNAWKNLLVFLKAGHVELDNNRAERALKPIVIGRKNYLFAGSEAGGEAAAIIYSLTETCREQGLNSEAYLADVLSRVATHPNKRIQELLPHHWQPPNSQEEDAAKEMQKKLDRTEDLKAA